MVFRYALDRLGGRIPWRRTGADETPNPITDPRFRFLRELEDVGPWPIEPIVILADFYAGVFG